MNEGIEVDGWLAAANLLLRAVVRKKKASKFEHLI